MNERLLPLGIKNPVKTELPALIALEAIGHPWFNDTHFSDLCAMVLVSQALGEDRADVQDVCGELVALLEARPLDGERIRPLALELLAWMQRQPNPRVQAAIEKVFRQNCATPA